MNGPHATPPPVTDAAVAAAARAIGVANGTDIMRRALEAAAPHMVPPPVLPTEPGAVVLASRIRDRQFDPPTVAVMTVLGDGPRQRWLTPGVVWSYDDVDDSTIWVAAGDITEWIPARVVPDDEHGPVAVLRRVSERLAADPGRGEVEDLLIVVGVCLERVDGAE